MTKLVQIVLEHGQYHLREIIINSTHITSIIPDNSMAGLNANGKLPEGLHEAQQFSKITFTNGKEIVAVGNPDMIGAKTKKVLHG
ncbi:MAG: hypothetical protein CMB80_01475 [Flammeovirgaceae bacterium]|nr:hypothetical protein [Flammeovirgaceae bacterium]